ncbi:folylpolyglutamate synthase, mitochondrial-like [Ciona intestinalis]
MLLGLNKLIFHRGISTIITRGYQQQMAAIDTKYEEAVQTLNELQCYKMLSAKQKLDGLGLLLMKEFLHRVDVSEEDINDLRVIHVTGTKGKGSTCAFVESILRKHGVRTGFYSSPHLLEVRERIRLNGRPISTELFTKYFWEVHELLKISEDDYEAKIPSYFYMLTILAFYIFKHEKVGAAVIEVGIGGAFDATNVISHPICCGVAALGIDHTDYLGNTIEKIAWQKGGIFKPNTPAFTLPQPTEGMAVLEQRANEFNVDLKIVPNFDSYPKSHDLTLGLSGDHQKLNASLATQLANCWLQRTSMTPIMTSPNLLFPLNETFQQGLQSCVWNGRGQVIKFRSVSFYLDGAHTVRSLTCATKWFMEESSREEFRSKTSCEKILAFNVTSNRDAKQFLEILFPCGFTRSLFVPNIASHAPSRFNDQNNLKIPIENQIFRIFANRDAWKEVCQVRGTPTNNDEAQTFLSVADALSSVTEGRDDELWKTLQSMTSQEEYPPMKLRGKHLQVFVTGSLHLVGAFLRILKPDMNE